MKENKGKKRTKEQKKKEKEIDEAPEIITQAITRVIGPYHTCDAFKKQTIDTLGENMNTVRIACVMQA